MKTDPPVTLLRALWKEAFGDTDAFLDLFFDLAYDPGRCCCIAAQDRVTAALYWLDVFLGGQKFAYIYAVATAKDCRGRGLCRLLMADTAEVLKQQGYCGALLVPQDEGLRSMYGRMGYRDAAPIDEFFCAAGDDALPIREISAEAYASLRAAYLPEGSLELGSKALSFLGAMARFCAGDGFLAVASREPEHLRILEYLGDRSKIPGLIAALGATEATVRTPGSTKPFAMFLPLTDGCTAPAYYPFAFD